MGINSVSLPCTVLKVMKIHVQYVQHPSKRIPNRSPTIRFISEANSSATINLILHLPKMQRSTNAGTRVASTDKNTQSPANLLVPQLYIRLHNVNMYELAPANGRRRRRYSNQVYPQT